MITIKLSAIAGTSEAKLVYSTSAPGPTMDNSIGTTTMGQESIAF